MRRPTPTRRLSRQEGERVRERERDGGREREREREEKMISHDLPAKLDIVINYLLCV
jgi:hypothetical protein